MWFVRGGRPLAIGVGLVAAGLALGAGLSYRMLTPAGVDTREGDTVVGFLSDDVLSLAYATPAGITTAQRSKPGAPFEVLSTFSNGRPTQRCIARPDMGGRLDRLSTLTARRSMSLAQRADNFPVQLGVIEFRDAMLAEPAGPILVFTNKDRTAVAVILDGAAVEVTLKLDDLRWLETACAGHDRS